MNPTLPCSSRLNSALNRVRTANVTETCGRVVQLIGLVVESEGPSAAVGEVCRIKCAGNQGDMLAEVVGFRNHHLLLMPLGEIHGIHPGAEVIATGSALRVGVGAALKGRVIDGLGKPLDDLGPIVTQQTVGLNLRPPTLSSASAFKVPFKPASRRSIPSHPAGAVSAWAFSQVPASANPPCWE